MEACDDCDAEGFSGDSGGRPDGAGYSSLLNASIRDMLGDTRCPVLCTEESIADNAASISGPLFVLESADKTLCMVDWFRIVAGSLLDDSGNAGGTAGCFSRDLDDRRNSKGGNEVVRASVREL